MDFVPKEDSVVINPITGTTMIGKYIERDFSKNVLKEDELANINRMRIHFKSQPRMPGMKNSDIRYVGNTLVSIDLRDLRAILF